MKQILIIGAGGFIGRSVTKYLIEHGNWRIIKQKRQLEQGYLSCGLESPVLQDAVDNSDFIINCAGVGLSRLAAEPRNNTHITEMIVKMIMRTAERDKKQLIHLSSVKAFNPDNYIDPYAADKAESEKILLDHQAYMRGLILRIPAVFGAGDKNLVPAFKLAAYKILPHVTDKKLPPLHFMGLSAICEYIYNWIKNKGSKDGIQTIYLVSKRTITYNELVDKIYKVIGSSSHAIPDTSLKSIKIIYRVLGLISHLLYRDRRRYPKQRFDDLFLRTWSLERYPAIQIRQVDIDLIDIIRESYDTI